MTQRPLARIGLLAGAMLAVSVGISGIAQAHTTAQVDPSAETMASHMDMSHMDTMTSAMLAEMAPLGPLTAGPHGQGHEYGTVGGERLGMQHKGKKCCAHCKGKEKARHHKGGSCCGDSRASHNASAHEGRATGCCKNAKKAKSA